MQRRAASLPPSPLSTWENYGGHLYDPPFRVINAYEIGTNFQQTDENYSTPPSLPFAEASLFIGCIFNASIV